MRFLTRALFASLWCALAVSSTSLKSSLFVHFPNALIKTHGYDHTVAHFGKDNILGGWTHRTFYAQQDGCSTLDRTNFSPKPAGNDTKAEAFVESPFILLLDRTKNCGFVQQARHAQHAGAAALVILDTQCICDDTDCSYTGEDCQAGPPFLQDDGSAGDISIPAMLVKKPTGDTWRTSLVQKGQSMLTELRFTYHKPEETEKIPYHVWTTPTDSVSRWVMNELGAVAVALEEHAEIYHHPYLLEGRGYLQCGPGRAGDAACQELCTNQGLYCAASNYLKNITGAAIVVESLRRVCITENLTNNKQFWEYVHVFQHKCFHEGKFSDPGCINMAFDHAGIDRKMIEQCMENSGGTETGEGNNLLNRELATQQELSIVRHPSAIISKRQVDHPPSGIFMLQSICDKLDWTLPVCHACGDCYPDVAGCIELGSCKAIKKKDEEYERKQEHEHHHHGHPFFHFVKTCFILALAGGGGYAAWIYSHRNGYIGQAPPSFMDQGRGSFTEYLNLSSQDPSDTGDYQPVGGPNMPLG